ncbi:MAG: hypothetical protein ABFD53_03995, partial [Anaerolineaceae bacterium]
KTSRFARGDSLLLGQPPGNLFVIVDATFVEEYTKQSRALRKMTSGFAFAMTEYMRTLPLRDQPVASG